MAFIHKEESCDHVVRIRTDPDMSVFSEIFVGNNCKVICWK